MTTLKEMWNAVAPDDNDFLVALSGSEEKNDRLCVVARLPGIAAGFERPALRIKDKGNGTFQVREKRLEGIYQIKEGASKYTTRTLSNEETAAALKKFCRMNSSANTF